MIFVDEHARVYQSWEEYKVNNDYPAGYLVAPTLGIYNTNGDIDSDNFNRVQLEVFPSSCVTTGSKLAATAGMPFFSYLCDTKIDWRFAGNS